MKVYVEDVSEDYGTHGVSVYSVVRGMEFFDAEVRASGIEVKNRDGSEIENEDLLKELVAAVYDKTIEQTKEAISHE